MAEADSICINRLLNIWICLFKQNTTGFLLEHSISYSKLARGPKVNVAITCCTTSKLIVSCKNVHIRTSADIQEMKTLLDSFAEVCNNHSVQCFNHGKGMKQLL